MTTFVATINAIRRLRHSPDGNPHYEIAFAGEQSYRTEKDSAVGHAVENHHLGDVVEVTLNQHGAIIALRTESVG